ncbi:hypothetical protein E2C01_065339 [Portunus trituberculatus]|uniref:Uncharacterized protein n=1 Tax=Portunus trituberculatus TaxID=210409 RepID=A0A5B7HFC3_PORTR|nr:hypothetical protein [Portunus trituberculatus]
MEELRKKRKRKKRRRGPRLLCEGGVAASWWAYGRPAKWSGVFLQSHHLCLSHEVLQYHFTQLATVLRVVVGSCGRCGLVFFASRAAAQRVAGTTHYLGSQQLCLLLVEKDTANHFWRSGDGKYRCDVCVCLHDESLEADSEDRLFIAEEEAVRTDEPPCTEAPPPPCLRGWELSHLIQNERRSLQLLRHLRERSSRSMFAKEQLSYERLQGLGRIASGVVVPSSKEEASARLLGHLCRSDYEAYMLKVREEASLTLIRHLKGTLRRGDMLPRPPATD